MMRCAWCYLCALCPGEVPRVRVRVRQSAGIMVRVRVRQSAGIMLTVF